MDEIELQRAYYADSADRYEALHVAQRDEHYFAAALMVGMFDFLDVRSVLDVGAGTGRTVAYVRALRPDVRIVGVEPVAALREVGHANGIPSEALIDGDALALTQADGTFDMVTAFGVMHHIKTPARAVAEMLRVAGKAILISDGNNWGQGSMLARAVKHGLRALRLWRVVDWVKNGGKPYRVTDSDGVAYSYSVFNNYRQIRRACRSVHVMNSLGEGVHPLHQASHAVLLGVK